MEKPSIDVYLLRDKPQIFLDGEPVKFERGGSEQLFYYLADTGEDTYTRSELARLLYDEDDNTARRKLSKEALFPTPSVLKNRCFDQSDPDELGFSAENMWVDSQAFAKRAAELLRYAPISTGNQFAEAKSILTLYQDHFLWGYSPKSSDIAVSSSFSNWQHRRQKELAVVRHQLLDEVIRFYLEWDLARSEAQSYADQWLGSLEPGTMPLQYLIWIAAKQRQNEALRDYLEQLRVCEDQKAVVIGPSSSRWIELISSDRESISLSVLHLRGLRSSQKILGQDTRRLIGREAILEQISVLLSTNTPPIFAITGLPGAGKAQVARAAAQILRRKQPSYWVIDFELTPELDLELLVNQLLMQLEKPELVNLNIAAKRQHLKQLLQAPNIVIFIDEGHTTHLSDAKTRANLLETFEGARIVLIGRHLTSSDYYTVKIHGLTRRQTRDLLCQKIPRLEQTDEALFVELRKLMSGLPLLLHIIGGFIKKERIRLPSLIQELAALNNKPNHRQEVVTVYQTILRWLWRYMQLDEQHLLCVVSLFDATEGATLEALTTICSKVYSPGRVRQKMKLLGDLCLLEVQPTATSARYSLHPIIFELVREQAVQQAVRLTFLPKFEQNYIHYLLELVRVNHDQPLILDGQQHNILRLFDLTLVTGQHEWAQAEAVAALCQVSPYFERRGLYTVGSKLIERALEISDQQAPNPLRVYLLHHAGQMAAKQSNYELAQVFLENSLSDALSLEMRQDYGLLYLDFGLVQMQALDYENARVNLDRAAEWASNYGTKPLVYRIWVNLGVLAFRQSEFNEAYTHYKKVLDDLGDDAEALRPELQAIAQFALNAIGITLTNLQKPSQAQKYHQRSLILARSLNDPERLGYVYLNLGVAYFFLKKYEAARDCFIQGQHFARLTQNQELLTQIIWNRGALASAEDHHDKALRLLNTALSRTEKYQLHRMKPIVLVALGKACLKRSWRPKAQQCFVDALTSQDLSKVYAARAFYGLGLCAVINSSNGDNDARATHTQIQQMMKQIDLSPTVLPTISRPELQLAQKYYRHDFDPLYRIAHYRLVDALMLWLSNGVDGT